MRKLVTAIFLATVLGFAAAAQTPSPTPVDPLIAEKQHVDRIVECLRKTLAGI